MGAPLTAIVALFVLAATDPAVSFSGSVGNAPIWMDLKIPAADGEVSGTYLYKKHGKDIQLSGRRRGTKIVLDEKVNNKPTGTFKLEYRCSSETCSVQGQWRKPKGKSGKPVEAERTVKENKPCFLANDDELLLLAGGKLRDELDRFSGPDFHDPESKEPDVARAYEITSCKAPLSSIVISAAFYGGRFGTPRVSIIHHTFDLRQKKELDLWEQIEPSKREGFGKFVAERLEPLMREFKTPDHPQETWLRILADRKTQDSKECKTVDDLFRIQCEPEALVFYLEDASTLSIGYPNFMYPLDVNQYDAGEPVFARFSFGEFKSYLSKDSVFWLLADGPD